MTFSQISQKLQTVLTSSKQDLSKDFLLSLSQIAVELEAALNTEKTTPEQLENLRISILGKQGLTVILFNKLSKSTTAEKKELGPLINNLKTKFNSLIENGKTSLFEQEVMSKLSQDQIDVTLPVYSKPEGKLHPISYTLMQVVEIFGSLGFTVEEGPEIEDSWHNFDALNFDCYHPAKDNSDTFYFKDDQSIKHKTLLRTHTSNVQIRSMSDMAKNLSPNSELKIIAPGKVYRRDDDSTHTPMFHQLEGLYLTKHTSLSELKYIIQTFCSYFFEIESPPLRFRPSYFPFTTPSLEVDIGCSITKDKIEIGKGNDWLEILGAGMVHPNVLKQCNIPSDSYKGFAFGIGLERISMLKYGFRDLRHFFSNNYKWLQSYGFSPLKQASLTGGF